MSRKGLFIYTLLLMMGSTIAVAVVSALLAMNGYVLPWIEPLADGSGYAIRNAWILLPGIALGALLAWLSHTLARRTGNSMYYFSGWILVGVVIAAAALLLYGGACGFCAKQVCSVGGVKSCGIQIRLSLTFFKFYCECFQPSGWMPDLPAFWDGMRNIISQMALFGAG